MKRARQKKGSVVLDRRRGVWNELVSEDGHRRTKKIGLLRDLPTKASAEQALKDQRNNSIADRNSQGPPTVNAIVEQYRLEKMPRRRCTSRGYDCWLRNHIVPRWGPHLLTDVQPREAELWLAELPLAPKSRAHIRGVLRRLWDFAMWARLIPIGRNPMELVTVRGASKRTRKPRSLTVEEFQKFLARLEEPFHTIALVCVCFGLRISEALALRWSDVNWLNATLQIERGIVRQVVDDVKTESSHKPLFVDGAMLEVLKHWKQLTQFQSGDDWIFASPVQHGRLPWSYPMILRLFGKAASEAGIEHVSTHTMRHTYRSWLDAKGTSIAVQQKLMRHASITTTMNHYGDVISDEMEQANTKVAGLALGRAN